MADQPPVWIKNLVERKKHLRNERVNWERLWQDVAQLVMPRKADFTTYWSKGAKRNMRQYDSTAQWANEQLAAGLHGALTSPSLPWFALAVRDHTAMKNRAVLVWLDEVQEVMNGVFNDPENGFHTAAHEVYLDMGAFATAVMFVEDAFPKIPFHAVFLGECLIAEDRRGVRDTVFRERNWPLSHIEKRFGADKLPEQARKSAGKNPDATLPVFNVTLPKEDYLRAGGPALPRLKDWASVWVLEEPGILLDVKGYEDDPYLTPRWARASGELYGRGPAITCLPDIQMANEIQKTLIRQAQLATDPPISAPNDGFVTPIRLNPGTINFYEPHSPGRVEAMQLTGQIHIGQDALQDTRQAITRAFHIPALQMPGQGQPGGQNPYMSATETLERAEEKRMMLGPLVSRMQMEFLRPLIDRVFGILSRNNALPPPPAEIQGKDLDVRFVGPMAQSQMQNEAKSIMQFLSMVSPVAERDESLMDLFDGDEFTREVAKITHLPARILRDERVVQKIREERVREEELAVAHERAPGMARSIKDITQAMGG